MMSDKKVQQEKLHPLVNSVHLAGTSFANSGTELQANFLASVEDLPDDLKELPWVKEVRDVYLKLKEGSNQTSALQILFTKGKKEDVLPEGYMMYSS